MAPGRYSTASRIGRTDMSELRRIPGVGAQTEKDLLMLGYPTIASLRGADPEEMYRRECAMRGV